MSDTSTLYDHCFVSTSTDGDNFVGIRSDGDSLSVFFPLGYSLSRDENVLRRDIMNLIAVLATFSEAHDKNIIAQNILTHETVAFPIQAYMGIMSEYRNNNSNLYTEREIRFRRGLIDGKVSWSRTIKQEKPIWSEGSPIYLQGISRENVSNAEKLITLVHEYCVYESYQKVGFLFPGDEPARPRLNYDYELFLSTIRQKRQQTQDDRIIALLNDMIAVIEYLGDKNAIPQFYFGTDRFEYVWEKMIDFTFGIDDKDHFFPHTYWLLDDEDKRNSALEPDTIMIQGNNIFVLDAKYYRYGDTKISGHLPQSSSINKQITYGEYIATEEMFKKEYGDNITVYNAFLMPYSMFNKKFHDAATVRRLDKYLHIGEAVSDWKSGKSKYEHVQGILVDVRTLMHNYIRQNDPEIDALSHMIATAATSAI